MSHSATYSREYSFPILAGVASPVCLEIPVPIRGTLQRLIIKQLAGASIDFSGKFYDRRLACANAVDRNVNSGEVLSLADNGGTFRIELGAGHGFLPGQEIYVKGTGNAAVDGILHTISSVLSETVTVTTAFSGATGTGLWQTKWLYIEDYDNMTFYDSEAHLIHEFAAPGAGVTLKDQSIEADYANRDNQDLTARRPHSAIYLELTISTAADSTWLVSISADLPALNFSG
jgi:hypothetical protein